MYAKHTSSQYNLLDACYIHCYTAWHIWNIPSKTYYLVGGFNPFETYLSNWESSPNRDENKTCLKPQPRYVTLPLTLPFFPNLHTLNIPSQNRLFHMENFSLGAPSRNCPLFFKFSEVWQRCGSGESGESGRYQPWEPIVSFISCGVRTTQPVF